LPQAHDVKKENKSQSRKKIKKKKKKKRKNHETVNKIITPGIDKNKSFLNKVFVDSSFVPGSCEERKWDKSKRRD
jgi:hypothetical protein